MTENDPMPYVSRPHFKRPPSPKLAVGDTVFVHESRQRHRAPDRVTEAVVVKAGRVWLTLAQPGKDPEAWQTRTWKMRRNTQAVDSQYSNADRFRTPEQEDWHREMDALYEVQRRHGIEVNAKSRWGKDEAAYRRLIAFLLESEREPLPVRVPGASLVANPVPLEHHAAKAFGGAL